MVDRSLIRYDGIPPELVEAQKAKQLAALTCLITGETPKDVIFQRKVSKDREVDYVPGWWFINQLNALFGYFWDFEIEAQEIGQENCWVRGKLTIKDPKSGLSVTKTAFGGSKIKSRDNPAIDIGDDLKAAATDSLKKAATLLGLASDIYGKREVLTETLGTRSQLQSLYTIGEKKGIGRDEIVKLSMDKYQKNPEELESIDVLTLLREVRGMPVKVGVVLKEVKYGKEEKT